MALAKVVDFENYTPPDAIGIGGDVVGKVGTYNASAASKFGSVCGESINGGFVQISNDNDVHGGSIWVNVATALTGSARVLTFTDNLNTFLGMIRFHVSGVWDICDTTTTRQASSVATWVATAWYRLAYLFTGSGTARVIALRVYDGNGNGTPVWDSGNVPVTAGSSNPCSRIRIGAQGVSAGTVRDDQFRLYDTAEWTGGDFVPSGGSINLDLAAVASASKHVFLVGSLTTELGTGDDTVKSAPAAGLAKLEALVAAVDAKEAAASGSQPVSAALSGQAGKESAAGGSAVVELSMQAVASSLRAASGAAGVSLGLSGLASKRSAAAGSLPAYTGIAGSVPTDGARPVSGMVALGLSVASSNYKISPVTGVVETGLSATGNTAKQALSAGALELLLTATGTAGSQGGDESFAVFRFGNSVPATLGGVIRNGVLTEIAGREVYRGR